MSPASDVAEMQGICAEVADLLRLPENIQARTNELRRLFGRDLFGWNRINEFVRGKARRVDGWEKDHARSIRDQLKREADDREDAKHIEWLSRSLAHLEASDPDFYRPEISALERALGVRRSDGSAVAVPGPHESDAEYDQSRAV